MRRPGRDRTIAARELVPALRPRLDTGEAARDRDIDRAIIAKLEMQIGDIGDAAPIAAIESVGTQQVHRSRDRLYPVPCDDETAAVGHASAHQVECLAGQTGMTQFARAG